LAWCRAGYRPIRLWAPCWPQPWLLTGSVLATAWCEYRYLAGHSLAVDWCLGGYGLVRAWVPSWPQPGSGQAPCCASYSLVQVWVLCWRRPGTSMGTVLATEHGGGLALCWLQPCTTRLPCWPWCAGAVLAAGYRAGHRLVRAWLPSWPQPEWTCAVLFTRYCDGNRLVVDRCRAGYSLGRIWVPCWLHPRMSMHSVLATGWSRTGALVVIAWYGCGYRAAYSLGTGGCCLQLGANMGTVLATAW
jgi:hypothetical protein